MSEQERNMAQVQFSIIGNHGAAPAVPADVPVIVLTGVNAVPGTNVRRAIVPASTNAPRAPTNVQVTQRAAMCCIFFVALLFVWPVGVAELVIAFIQYGNAPSCEPIAFTAITWLIVSGIFTVLIGVMAIVGVGFSTSGQDDKNIMCVYAIRTISVFKLIWSIIGGVMVWSYCTDISAPGVYTMMFFSVIYGLISGMNRGDSGSK